MIAVALLSFLSAWQMPLKRKSVSEPVIPPKPAEVR
jgi:hypothetical protein